MLHSLITCGTTIQLTPVPFKEALIARKVSVCFRLSSDLLMEQFKRAQFTVSEVAPNIFQSTLAAALATHVKETSLPSVALGTEKGPLSHSPV